MDDRMARDAVAAEPRSMTPFQSFYPDETVIVGVGEHCTVSGPAQLGCLGLGSCVGIAIYDLFSQVGGLAHAMLPRYEEGRDKINAFKYADSAIMLMVDELVDMGAVRTNLRAKVAGGAQMFSFMGADTLNIGLRNSRAAVETLRNERIRVVGEDLGGTRGRTITFNVHDGSYLIRKGERHFEI